MIDMNCSICGKKMKFEAQVPRVGWPDSAAFFSCECGHIAVEHPKEHETLRSW